MNLTEKALERIPITLTRAGKVIGHYTLSDVPDDAQRACIQIAAETWGDRIRTITRTNDEWQVELEPE